MALYKNLGQICFYDETEHCEIFQTSQEAYVLQLKPHIAISSDLFESLLKKQVDAYSQGIPLSINARIYKEKGKPLSLILNNCIPLDFSHLQINQICKIVQAMQRTILSWPNERLGQISKSLFFISHDKTIFFSLPLIEKPKDADHSKLLNQVIIFVQSICRVSESSHSLLLKRVKSSKTLQNLFEETKYFANIYSLKIKNNFSSKSGSNIRKKLSIHSDSAKRSRLKFAIFKQNNSISSIHQGKSSILKSNNFNSDTAFNAGQGESKIQNHEQYDRRCSSKALHLSSSHFSSNIWKKKSNNASQKKPQTSSQRSILNVMKHQKSLHKQQSMHSVKNSRDLIDSKSSFAVSKVFEQSIPKTKKSQSLLKRRSSRHNSRQSQNLIDLKASLKKGQKMDAVFEQNKKKMIKEIVNKSLQKLKKNRQQKIVMQSQQRATQYLSKNATKQQKKLLKRAIHHPQHKTLYFDEKIQQQIQPILQKQQQKIKAQTINKVLSNNSQINIILSNNLQQKDHARPSKTQLTFGNLTNCYQTGQVDQKSLKNSPKDKKSRQKLSAQTVQRIPLRQAHQNQFATANNSSNISLKKIRQKEAGSSSKRKIRITKSIEQRLNQRLQILDFVGQAVRNTQVCYRNNRLECPWQIPAFYLYRQYLIERLQVEQQGNSSIRQQNQQIGQSLQKLYSAAIKKINKIRKKGKQFVSQLVTCDLTIRDQEQFRQTIKQYIQMLFTALKKQTYSYMLPHAIEIVDAYAILTKEQFDKKRHQQIMNAVKNQQLMYLRERSDLIFASDKQKSKKKK